MTKLPRQQEVASSSEGEARLGALDPSELSTAIVIGGRKA